MSGPRKSPHESDDAPEVPHESEEAPEILQESDETPEVRSERPLQVADAMDLETPILLVSMPQVLDPFFHMSVVLLIQHEREGSRGFIVNRPTGVTVSDILEGLEIPWGGDGEQTAHFGGPVQPQIGTVIYSFDDHVESDGDEPSSTHEIYPGVALTQNIHDLQSLAERPPDSLRLFLGYAGWGEGQLMQEIVRNDWITAPVTHDLVFASDPSETWCSALRSVGVEPDQLPTWTPGDADDVAN